MQLDLVKNKFSHADLCTIAVKWLQRPLSKQGHDCSIALSEIKSGWGGEIPDAIGWRSKGDKFDGSVLVECKVSRSDFLTDKNKAHRANGGIGCYRYFLCPDGIIKASELPAGWGLLYVNSRGHIKPQVGAVCATGYTGSAEYYSGWQLYAHKTDYSREQFILVRLLKRFGDPQQLHDKFKELSRDNDRLRKRANDEAERYRESSMKARRYIWRLEQQLAAAGLTPLTDNGAGNA